MICAKFCAHGRDTLLAGCDAELLGKKLGDFVVSERFYGTEEVTEEKFAEMLDNCTIANLTGERVINAAKKKGLIRDGGVQLLDGVPHAQIVRML